MIKLVVFDLDGTLLDDSKELREDVKKAIITLKENNVEYTIASGRGYSSILKYAKLIDTSLPLISLDGALVKNTNLLLLKKKIDRENLGDLIEILKKFENKVFAIFYGEEHCLVPPSGIKNIHLNRWEVIPERADWDEILKMEILRGYVVSRDFRVLKRINLIIENIRGIKTHLFPSEVEGYFYLDIRPWEVNKGNGLKSILSYFNILPQEVAVIGDFYNDLEMFEISGVKIAMKNAVYEVKKKADYITERTHNEGGVIDAVEFIKKRINTQG